MNQDNDMAGGRLTTHVLDTAAGRPAGALRVDLFRLNLDAATMIGSTLTNADGRCAAPLLAGDDLIAGDYQLVFHVGDYFRGQDLDLPDPLFLDHVPIRFGIADPTRHYHVPLLISPFGYTTYRGS